MYPKNKVTKVIDLWSKDFIRLLDLKSYTICFHVMHSKSKKLKQYKLSDKTSCAISLTNNKCADILIYYDLQKDYEDTVASLFHELLHVKFYSLTNMVTLKAALAFKEEEKIVSNLEDVFMTFFFDKDLKPRGI